MWYNKQEIGFSRLHTRLVLLRDINITNYLIEKVLILMKLSNYEKTALFVILEGIAAAVILNLYNPFTQIFSKRLGATDLHIALINSFPQLVAIIVLIPCSLVIERIRDKKKATCILIIMNSAFYAFIAFVPFLPEGLRLNAYVLLIGLMNWPGSLYTTTWQSFFSYTFSGNEASSIYSLRSKYSAFFGLLAALITGLAISWAPWGGNNKIIVYQFIYAICFGIALLQVLFLSMVKDNTSISVNTESSKVSFRLKDFKEILSNRDFTTYSLCSFAFHISWHMGWPLFFIYHVDYVKANEFQLGLISVVAGLASFLSYSLWNSMAEKRGSSLVIVFGALGLAANPFMYILTRNIYWVLAINVVTGLAMAAFNLSLFCNLIELLPENKKTIYISFFNTFIYISGCISPLIGIWIYGHIGIIKTFETVGFLRIIAASLLFIRWVKGRKNNSLNLRVNAES